MLKQTHHRCAYTLAAILSFLSLPSKANNETQTNFASMSLQDLVSVEVFTSASLLPTVAAKAPGTAYSFQRSDFQRFGVRRLEDLLQFIPGFQLNQNRKRHRSIWARGLLDRYNDKLVLMVDGVPVKHLYYGHFALGDNLPIEKIEKVEVILGPASSLYGANAFGGIISVTTRSFSESPHVTVTMDTGDNNRAKGSALYNSERLQAFGSYLAQDAPYRDNRKSFIGGNIMQPEDEHYQNLQVKALVLPGFTLSADYSENKTPFLFIPNTQDAFIEQESYNLAVNYQVGDLRSGKLEARAYYQNDKAREFELEQISQDLGYEEFQNATMAGATLTGFKSIQDHMLAVGASWQRERAQNTSYQRLFFYRDGFLAIPDTGNLLSQPNISNDNYAVFIQDVWQLHNNLNLTLGARYDEFEAFDDYYNYRTALVYTPTHQQTWKLLYGTAIRTPSYREYLKVLEGTSFTPPPLDAESIKSLELGYIYQWENANINVNIFNNSLTDFIQEMPTPDGFDEYFANGSEKLHIKGGEALINLKANDNLMLRFTAAYLDTYGSRQGDMPYLAHWKTSFNLNYQFSQGHNMGFSLVHNSDRSDTNTTTVDDADTFVIMNLHASGPISKTVSYSLGVDNLFDERVYDAAADFGAQYNPERSKRELWVRFTWKPTL